MSAPERPHGSDYLTRLANRAAGQRAELTPRLPSVFEPRGKLAFSANAGEEANFDEENPPQQKDNSKSALTNPLSETAPRGELPEDGERESSRTPSQTLASSAQAADQLDDSRRQGLPIASARTRSPLAPAPSAAILAPGDAGAEPVSRSRDELSVRENLSDLLRSASAPNRAMPASIAELRLAADTNPAQTNDQFGAMPAAKSALAAVANVQSHSNMPLPPDFQMASAGQETDNNSAGSQQRPDRASRLVTSSPGALRAPVNLRLPACAAPRDSIQRNRREAAEAAVPMINEPVINVSIGRVEVRATHATLTEQRAAPAKPQNPPVSLDDYLKQRGGAR